MKIKKTTPVRIVLHKTRAISTYFTYILKGLLLDKVTCKYQEIKLTEFECFLYNDKSMI